MIAVATEREWDKSLSNTNSTPPAGMNKEHSK
jgi:hypothetical protein